MPFLVQVYFRPLTVFVAPAGEQLEPGFGATEAEVEPTASAITKTVAAEIEDSVFMTWLLLWQMITTYHELYFRRLGFCPRKNLNGGYNT